jgi:hypothetical protein
LHTWLHEQEPPVPLHPTGAQPASDAAASVEPASVSPAEHVPGKPHSEAKDEHVVAGEQSTVPVFVCCPSLLHVHAPPGQLMA